VFYDLRKCCYILYHKNAHLPYTEVLFDAQHGGASSRQARQNIVGLRHVCYCWRMVQHRAEPLIVCGRYCWKPGGLMNDERASSSTVGEVWRGFLPDTSVWQCRGGLCRTCRSRKFSKRHMYARANPMALACRCPRIRHRPRRRSVMAGAALMHEAVSTV
jgi:hypothetical protein